jgi:hypothetical protein
MVSYGRPQIFELAPGCRLRATLPDISITSLAADIRQRCLAEEVQNPP